MNTQYTILFVGLVWIAAGCSHGEVADAHQRLLDASRAPLEHNQERWALVGSCDLRGVKDTALTHKCLEGFEIEVHKPETTYSLWGCSKGDPVVGRQARLKGLCLERGGQWSTAGAVGAAVDASLNTLTRRIVFDDDDLEIVSDICHNEARHNPKACALVEPVALRKR